MKAAETARRIALVGDMHRSWDEEDVRYFNASNYDLVLFIGDLGAGTKESDRKVARRMAALDKPVVVMPGNNDADHAALIEAELTHRRGLASLRSMVAGEQVAGASVTIAGYSLHRYGHGDGEYTMLCARPYAMGGGELSYAAHLAERFGIDSMERSRARLEALVSSVETEGVLFVAHQGPFGLGAAPTDPWSADFLEEPRDWGDEDLSHAISLARARGLRVLGVLAGHMHHGLESGGERRWKVEHEGVTHVNPAKVPRIFARGDNVFRHHVEVVVTPKGIVATEVLVPEYA